MTTNTTNGLPGEMSVNGGEFNDTAVLSFGDTVTIYSNDLMHKCIKTFITEELAIAREEAEQKGRDEAVLYIKKNSTEQDGTYAYVVNHEVFEQARSPKPINHTN